jgi:hypothetical protein
MGEVRNVYKVLVGKCKGKIPTGKPKCMWQDNIKINPTAIGFGGAEQTHLAHDRDQRQAVVNNVVNMWVP